MTWDDLIVRLPTCTGAVQGEMSSDELRVLMFFFSDCCLLFKLLRVLSSWNMSESVEEKHMFAVNPSECFEHL